MSLVPDPETGELVESGPMTQAEAEAVTFAIAEHVGKVWRLLVVAYERQAHTALGYSSWADYTKDRFGISRSRSYQLIDQAYVIGQIEAAVLEVTGEVSTDVDITEADARDIKPVIDDVTDEITEAISGGASAPEAIADVVARKRAAKKAEGGSNPAPKGGAPVHSTDPPSDPQQDAEDVEEHATTVYREDFEKAMKAADRVLHLSPLRALEDGDIDFRRNLARHADDHGKFANACKAALLKSQQIRSVK